MKPTRRKERSVPLTTSPSALEIRQLRAFVALVDAKRVTAAADVLGLAQSTVSEALAALERSIGAPLVLRQRGGHGAELTEAGRALLPHARKILAAVNDAHVAMIATTSRARANVDIVANESISTYLLPDILPMLRQRWPRTRFTVSVATCAGVRDGVAGGAFDVGLLLAEPAGNASGRGTHSPVPFTDRRVVIPAVPLVLFAGHSHPLVRSGAFGLVGHRALSGYPLFVSDAAGEFHDLVEKFFRREGVDKLVIEASGSVEGVKKAVIADGRAIGLLPLYSVADELRATTFDRVNLRPAPPRMRLDALLSQSRARHPSAEELLVAIGPIIARLSL
jgi:DNA-binding transcriptional LysR family regulator